MYVFSCTHQHHLHSTQRSTYWQCVQNQLFSYYNNMIHDAWERSCVSCARWLLTNLSKTIAARASTHKHTYMRTHIQTDTHAHTPSHINTLVHVNANDDSGGGDVRRLDLQMYSPTMIPTSQQNMYGPYMLRGQSVLWNLYLCNDIQALIYKARRIYTHLSVVVNLGNRGFEIVVVLICCTGVRIPPVIRERNVLIWRTSFTETSRFFRNGSVTDP